MIEALVVFLIILVLLAGATLAMQRAKLRRLGRRDPLSDLTLMALFSAAGAPDNMAIRFLDAVARAADIPRGFLRPADRFDAELAPERGWEFDDGIALLPWVLASEFGGTAEEYDLSKTPTVIGLLTLVVRNSRQHRWGKEKLP
jgi:hypothetical protein